MPKPLEVSLISDTEIRIARAFDAPAALVFRAWSEPALVQRWLSGPPGWRFTRCEIDARLGGEYRFAWANEAGVEFGLTGVYSEIEPPTRWVSVEQFDGAPTKSTVTTELVEVNAVTNSIMTLAYESKEARDRPLQSGMTDGMEHGYKQLDAVLTEEQA